ncbi:MAG TPA: diguanylate cyclase [Gemmatimonadota bacterium]|jgi:diguanylate cyclase (GGDEF)-like protein
MALSFRGTSGTALGLALISAVGWVDFLTGPDYGLSLLYLVPVVAGALLLGRIPGILLGVWATLAWFLADLGWSETPFPSMWNGVTRLVIYVGAAVAAARLQSDRRALRALYEREQSLSRTDFLTQLPNARSFLETLGAEIARRRQSGGAVCVMYVDVDRFKQVNDRFGHRAGDELLRRIGLGLRQAVRDTDVAARLGGDEFAVLLWDVDRAVVQGLAERIAANVEEAGGLYPDAGVRASIGIAYVDRPSGRAEEVLRSADEAMYGAKRGGGSGIAWARLPELTPPPRRPAERREPRRSRVP